MIARITTPASMLQTLNYNEHKVRRGVAQCIAENHFPYSVHAMNFYDKYNWFKNRNELNSRATTQTLHISLNFDPSENLSNECLVEIAADYMNRIGFADQPYLVYRHLDAAHPHMHILATAIRSDGSRIDLHNIAKEKSEPARKLIEENYHLVKAEGRQQKSLSANTEIAIYGRSETKRGIANALKQVLAIYNYTSLPELNAVLKTYGVMADRGKEDSFTFRKNGLLYRMLDKDGVPTGVPIKASSIAGKPTLNYLQQQFEKNKRDRELPKLSLRNNIDKTLSRNPKTLDTLKALLQEQNITVILRQNAEGRIYGITFVDHKNKIVCNGSEIGKPYSIAVIYKQMAGKRGSSHPQDHHHAENLIDTLTATQNSELNTPHQLKKKRKKKKHL